MPSTPRAFVLHHTHLRAVPAVESIRLHLADDVLALWRAAQIETGEPDAALPYWAFAWAGGQALARHVLDHPDLVAGRSVLDLASGGGLVALAAARAGASAVEAVDVDPLAVAAVRVNAAANGLAVTARRADLLAAAPPDRAAPGAGSVVLAGDVFYERSMAERMLRFLDGARQSGATVLVGDPRRAYLPRDRFRALAEYAVPVDADLEDTDVKPTTVWELCPAAPPGAGKTG